MTLFEGVLMVLELVLTVLAVVITILPPVLIYRFVNKTVVDQIRSEPQIRSDQIKNPKFL